MGVKITNNASGTLAAAITSGATTLTLTTGQGALFPTLGVGDYSWCTLVDTSNNVEIIKVTARSTDTLTMIRGQDDTTARAFAINDRLELRPTAALFAEFASTNVVDDTTPQLGGDLDFQTHKATSFTSTGIDDNATSTAITIDSAENVKFNGSAPKVQIGTSAVSTGATALEIGNGRTGNGNSYIDIISDTTYSDYGFRIIRGNTGANAATTLTNRGTGDLTIQTEEAGAIAFKTGAVEEMRILPAGGITFNGDTAAANALDDYEEGTWTPSLVFDVAGTGIVYGTRQGAYTKIGRLVTVSYMIGITSGVSASDYWCRLNLPFTGISANQATRQKQYNSGISDWALSSGGGNPVFYASNTISNYARGDDVNGRTITGVYTYMTT